MECFRRKSYSSTNNASHSSNNSSSHCRWSLEASTRCAGSCGNPRCKCARSELYSSFYFSTLEEAGENPSEVLLVIHHPLFLSQIEIAAL